MARMSKTFLCEEEIYDKFIVKCAQQKEGISEKIEELIKKEVDKK